MDVAELVLLGAALLMLAFTLGATIAWRLEGRRPLVAPLWLVVCRNVSWMAMVASTVVNGEPPSRIFAIDPLWWNLGEAAMVVLSIVIFVVDVGQSLRNRQPS